MKKLATLDRQWRQKEHCVQMQQFDHMLHGEKTYSVLGEEPAAPGAAQAPGKGGREECSEGPCWGGNGPQCWPPGLSRMSSQERFFKER